MSDPPEPQDLKSWQNAFHYPVPTVRRVEQDLRRDIESNKEKLRALVGSVEQPVCPPILANLSQNEIPRAGRNSRDHCFYEPRDPTSRAQPDRCGPQV